MKEKFKKLLIIAAIILIPGGEVLALLYYGLKKRKDLAKKPEPLENAKAA